MFVIRCFCVVINLFWYLFGWNDNVDDIIDEFIFYDFVIGGGVS